MVANVLITLGEIGGKLEEEFHFEIPAPYGQKREKFHSKCHKICNIWQITKKKQYPTLSHD